MVVPEALVDNKKFNSKPNSIYRIFEILEATITRSIYDSWKRARIDVVVKSFMKFWITNPFNGTKDDLLGDSRSGSPSRTMDWNGSAGDLVTDKSSGFTVPIIFLLNVFQIKHPSWSRWKEHLFILIFHQSCCTSSCANCEWITSRRKKKKKKTQCPKLIGYWPRITKRCDLVTTSKNATMAEST